MFSSLSDKQKEIVFEKSGKFIVRACPGSGKTYSVAARAAHRIQHWENRKGGIAVLSFTNVAWREVGEKLENQFGVFTANKYPHFLGTLDSFINQYVFLPFGHLVMGCEARPVLVGEPHNLWSYCPYEKCYEQYFDIVSYNSDESLAYPKIQDTFFFGYSKIYRQDGTESQHAANLRKVKHDFWQRGYANQSDANYFAVKILLKFPSVAKALVSRFPEFIIDEAQDTTEVQMRLIDILVENGLAEVMLIGDPDQAIYEWNNARPELFMQKYREWQENSIECCENRRSSQVICNFTSQLTTMPNPPTAINDDVKDCDFPIEIHAFDSNDVGSIGNVINAFIAKCKLCGIEATPEKVAVLFRSGDLINTIVGNPARSDQTVPWISGDFITRDVVKGKFLIDKGCYAQGYKLLEKALTKAVLNTHQYREELVQKRIDEIGIVQHRLDIYRFASTLPKTENIAIATWIELANCALATTSIRLNVRENCSALVQHLFQKEIAVVSCEYQLGTVHSVKGETFDAVLLLLKQKGGQEKFYRTLLFNGTKTANSEELRIAYVALTRPRKLLQIAVNEKDVDAWKRLHV